MTTLEDHDAIDDPVIALGCGHVFARSTLDGVVGIDTVYSKNNNGAWSGVLPLPAKCGAVPQCPSCRSPISNIRRYGRILAHLALEQASIKFRLKAERDSHTLQLQRTELLRRVEEIEEKGVTSIEAARDFITTKQQIDLICIEADGACRYVQNEQPEVRVYEAAVVALSNHPVTSIVAKRSLAQAFIVQLRIMTVEYQHVLANHDLPSNFLLHQLVSKKQKDKQKRRGDVPPPLPVLPLLDLAGQSLQKLGMISSYTIDCYDKLIKQCVDSQSNKSLVEVLQHAIEAMYFVISSTRKVVYSRKLPEPVTANSKEIITTAMTRMQQFLAHMTPVAPFDVVGKCRELVQRTEKLMRSEFYEAVTKEEKMAIFQAMSKDVGTGVGSFGGHWYTCPNGHVYTIGECGGAMQQSRCPECNANVGGQNHAVTTGTFLDEIGQLQQAHTDYH